jgi:3-hydroxyacyl-CoA dehydrogenase
MPAIRNVTVLGTGVLGAQIMYQTAYHGFKVCGYDINDDVLKAAVDRVKNVAAQVGTDIPDATPEKIQAGLDNIVYTSDLAHAVTDADLVIEAVPENLAIKREAYAKLAKLAPAKTIFCTNSSTMLPSVLAEYTGRPDRFMALHYANHVWRMNTAECMPSPKTDPAVFETVVAFAEQTGMVPIRIKKEVAGYLLNSMLIPLLDAACKLFANGYAEPKDIDAAWRIGTGAPVGPFQILDIVGLGTAYNIMAASTDPAMKKFGELVKTEYIDKGKMGQATGEGFYTYA